MKLVDLDDPGRSLRALSYAEGVLRNMTPEDLDNIPLDRLRQFEAVLYNWCQLVRVRVRSAQEKGESDAG